MTSFFDNMIKDGKFLWGTAFLIEKLTTVLLLPAILVSYSLQDYGYFSQASSLSSTLIIFLLLGQHSHLIRNSSGLLRNKLEDNTYIASAFLLMNTGVWALIFFFSPTKLQLIFFGDDNQLKYLIAIILLSFSESAFELICTSYLRAKQDFFTAAKILLAKNILRALLALIFFFYQFELPYLLYCYAFVSLILVAFNCRFFEISKLFDLKIKNFSEIKSGFEIFVNSGLVVLYVLSFRLIIAENFDSSVLGYFSSLITVSGTISVVPAIVGYFLFPKYASWHTNRDISKLRERHFRLILKLTFAFFLPVTLLWLFSAYQEVFSIFGVQFFLFDVATVISAQCAFALFQINYYVIILKEHMKFNFLSLAMPTAFMYSVYVFSSYSTLEDVLVQMLILNILMVIISSAFCFTYLKDNQNITRKKNFHE